MDCNISNLLLSAEAAASVGGSGSTEPRILESWAPRSQPANGLSSASVSTGISASCMSWSCCSAMCSVFCLFSAPDSSSASGVLDRLMAGPTSESGDIAGV